MRKWLFTILILTVSVGFIISINHQERSHKISILTYQKTYSRMISNNTETLDIPIYFDIRKSFFVDKDNISSVAIKDEFNTMEVSLDDITDTFQTYSYLGKLYYLFLFKINWTNIEANGLKFNLKDASLNISYVNDVSYSFKIGDIFLYFTDIEENNYLAFSNLYSIIDNLTNNQILGIVIAFNNLLDKPINITKIDVLMDDVSLDLNNAIKLFEKPDFTESEETILGYQYNHIVTEINLSYSLTVNQDGLYYIPIQYLNGYKSINRFPLLITFEFENREYSYRIDDFTFYSNNYYLEDNDGHIQEYLYNY